MDGPIRLQSLSALADGLTLPNGLNIDEATFVLPALTYDAKAQHLVSEGESHAKFRLSEASILELLKTKLPGQISNPQVRLADNMVSVTVSVQVLITIDVTARCKLRIQDGKELWVDLIDVDKPGPVYSIVEAQLSQINPVFSADTLPFPVTLTSCQVVSGWVELEAIVPALTRSF